MNRGECQAWIPTRTGASQASCLTVSSGITSILGRRHLTREFSCPLVEAVRTGLLEVYLQGQLSSRRMWGITISTLAFRKSPAERFLKQHPPASLYIGSTSIYHSRHTEESDFWHVLLALRSHLHLSPRHHYCGPFSYFIASHITCL